MNCRLPVRSRRSAGTLLTCPWRSAGLRFSFRLWSRCQPCPRSVHYRQYLSPASVSDFEVRAHARGRDALASSNRARMMG